MCAVSTYKKQKKQEKTQPQKHNSGSQSPTTAPFYQCKYCRHSAGKCPAKEVTCGNCGHKGHWAKAENCPAREAQCRSCRKIGHFDKCCRSRSSEDTTPGSHQSQPHKGHACRSADNTTSPDTPTPVCVHVRYGKTTSRLHMLPDTGADVTIIRERHFAPF
ncbi:hypothetical protein Pmani_012479 [Petrolisthes manimaculis]|uniref:Peptidase A2 domain-containing protein n=1 Tax=Petrolisthes manimaculis TaxID=1843537 RepID=A0AAE1PWY3_9EUCA|nr:hypothetical protein Pmani_012479 [Petrolisthes manimaculis]